MTFRDAIKAHAQWKLRLELLLSGDSTESLTPDTISRDDLCALGQWLHAPSTIMNAPEAFEELKATHAKFHKIVGLIVRDALDGRREPSQLAPDSEYSMLSLAIITQLKTMQRSLGVD